MSSLPNKQGKSQLLRLAVSLTLAGLCLILIYLLSGFGVWAIGLAFFLGVPLLLLGMTVTVIAMVQQLRSNTENKSVNLPASHQDQ